MLVDGLFAMLRALSFAALLQAAGATFFLAAFGRSLGAARDDVQRVALLSALAGLVLVLSQYLVEVARMTGGLSAIVDAGWHEIVLTSSAGTALSLRALGLALIAISLRRESDLAISAGVVERRADAHVVYVHRAYACSSAAMTARSIARRPSARA